MTASFRQTRGLIRLALLASLLLLAFVGVVSYRNTLRLMETDAQIVRTQEIRALISDIFDDTARTQFAARVYLITGRPDHRREWEDHRQRWERDGRRLRVLAGGHAEEAVAADRFLRLTALRLDDLRVYVEKRRPNDHVQGKLTPVEMQTVMKGEGESLENLNRAARHFRAQEEMLLPPRYAAADETARQTQFTIFLGAFVAVLVVAGAIILIDRDMQKRKMVEARLAASEQRFRALIENASDLITVLDTDGQVLYRSPSAVRLVADPTDGKATPPKERVHDDDRVAAWTAFQQVATKGGPPISTEYRYWAGDGSLRYLESIASNQITVPGVEGIVITSRDVTERRRAEDAVRDSELRLRETQRQARLGSWEYDVASSALHWSEEVRTLFGFDTQGPPPTYAEYLSRIHPDKLRETLARVAEAKASPGSAYEYDQMILLLDGSVRYSRSTLRAIADPETGDVVRLVGTTLDITERVEAERARERMMDELRESEARLRETAAELRRSNRELSAFATVASHDLQEPLRKIRTFADRIAQRTEGSLDATAADYLRRVQSAAVRMQSLVESLLELSQVSTRPPKLAPVDLNRIVAEVISDLESRLESSGGRVEVCGGLLPTLCGDPIPLRQLLQNLIGNALKFRRSETPSVVTVRGDIFSSADPDHLGEWVRLTVADNGIGFAPEYAHRIFEAFERLEGRDRYDGNGVGLAICRRIVERHGGSITACGIPGEGATFTVLIPRGLSTEAS